MHEKIINFIKYNNAFTIIVVMCFLSFGVTFAASPAVRDSIYSSTETVTSVDNGLIVSTDLDNFNFNLKIDSINEDDKNYYADYSYQTLEIDNSIWQIKQIEKTLTVSKEALNGKDLGLYVQKQLADNINYELSSLKKVQESEKEKGASQKVVTTEYSGLIGKMLNPKEEVLEGYEPVIPEPVPEAPAPPVEPNQETVEVPILDTTPKENPEQTPTTSTPIESVQDNATSTSTLENATSSATSTLEIVPESTSTSATSTPEVSPDATSTVLENSTSSATSTSEISPEATSTEETVSE